MKLWAALGTLIVIIGFPLLAGGVGMLMKKFSRAEPSTTPKSQKEYSTKFYLILINFFLSIFFTIFLYFSLGSILFFFPVALIAACLEGIFGFLAVINILLLLLLFGFLPLIRYISYQSQAIGRIYQLTMIAAIIVYIVFTITANIGIAQHWLHTEGSIVCPDY